MELSRDFFKDSIDECKESLVCEIPYNMSNPITSIGKEAFYDWESCRYVVIPPSVKEIAPDAFHWENIKIVISNGKLPETYKGIVLPFNAYSKALLEALVTIDKVEENVHLNSDQFYKKKEEVNRTIDSLVKDFVSKEEKLKEQATTLESAYQTLEKLFSEKQGLSDEQLHLIEQETLKRIKDTLVKLDEQEKRFEEQKSEINKSIQEGINSFQSTFMEIQSQRDKMMDQTRADLTKLLQDKTKEANGLKEKLNTMLDHLSAREDELTDAVVDRAVEKVREKSPFKNVNIYINNVLHGSTKKKIVHKNFEQVVKVLALHLHPLLVGPAGCGKNVMLEQASEALGLKFRYVNDVTEEHKVMGFVDANGRFQETQFFKAFTEGGLMMIDEIDNSHPSALLAINAALGTGYNQYLAFPDGKLYPCHKDFYCAAAANTYGTGSDQIYCGRSALDGASLNRFVPIFIDYDRNLETNLVSNEKLLPLYWAVRESVQANKIRHVISTRNIVNADKMLSSGVFTNGEIFDMTIIQSMTDDDLRMIVNDLENRNLDAFEKDFIYHLRNKRNISYDEYREQNQSSRGRSYTYSDDGYSY